MARKKSVITEKQQGYVDGVMVGKTKTQAAADAGYSSPGKMPVTIESSAAVQEALAEARSELRQEVQIERVDVVNGFIDAIDMARLAGEPASMISGWREIGKLLGHYEPEVKRVEITDDTHVMRSKLEQLTDDELVAMMQKRSLMIDAN